MADASSKLHGLWSFTETETVSFANELRVVIAELHEEEKESRVGGSCRM